MFKQAAMYMQVQVPANVLEYLTQQIQLPLQHLQPYIE